MTSCTTSDAEDLSSTFSDTEQDWGEEDGDTGAGFHALVIVRPAHDAFEHPDFPDFS